MTQMEESQTPNLTFPHILKEWKEQMKKNANPSMEKN